MNNGPGPGQYNLGNSTSGPQITVGAKTKASSFGDNNPGPGNYNLNSQSIYKNPNAFTLGAKYGNSKVEDPEPGPGSYNFNDGKKIGVKIGKSKRNGLGDQ